MTLPIYCDYMSSTPVDERVKKALLDAFNASVTMGNPSSSTHCYGWEGMEAIREGAASIASLIGANQDEVIWTSGATESNNLAIQGIAHFYQRQGKHLITMKTEHKSVLEVFEYLASEGFDVTYLAPDSQGRLCMDALSSAIRPDTILVSVMHVNNETGVIQDIEAIGRVVKSQGALFHVDAAQSFGKLPIDVKAMKIDALSISGHKIYAPKGIGALYLRSRPRVQVQPMLYGGGQQGASRPGTLPTHQIIALGAASQIAASEMENDMGHLTLLSNRFLEGIKTLPMISINGDLANKWPGCFNLRFHGIDNEALIATVRDIAISSGSACNAVDPNPSHVLTAMGLSRLAANESVRVSFGRATTVSDVETVIDVIKRGVDRLLPGSLHG